MKMNLVASTRLLLVAGAAAAMSVMTGCSTTGSAPEAKPVAEAAKPAELAVKITPTLGSVDVMHNGKPVTIMRNQDTSNKEIPPAEVGHITREADPDHYEEDGQQQEHRGIEGVTGEPCEGADREQRQGQHHSGQFFGWPPARKQKKDGDQECDVPSGGKPPIMICDPFKPCKDLLRRWHVFHRLCRS